MIIDVTDPKQPKESFHIPVPVAGGQSQMVRMCLGSDLPGGVPGHVYLMRNVQGNAAAVGIRDLGRDRHQEAVRGSLTGHSLHAQALVGVQDRRRVPAGQQGGRRPIDGARPSRWSSSTGAILRSVGGAFAPIVPGYPSTSVLRPARCAAGRPDRYLPRSTARSRRTSIRRPADTLARAPAQTTSSATGSTWRMASVTTACCRSSTARSCCRRAYGGTWNGANPDTPTDAELLEPQSRHLLHVAGSGRPHDRSRCSG